MEAFHDILRELIIKKDLNTNKASKFFKENGINVTRSDISTYINCNTIPREFRAKEMLKVLGYEISDEELKESLALSQVVKKNQTYGNSRYLWTGIRIPLTKLSDTEKNLAKIQSMLNQRMSEVNTIIGGKGISAYIATLIKADIEYNILDEILMEDKNGK